MTKIEAMKDLITKMVTELPAERKGVQRPEITKAAVAQFGWTQQQIDNILSYLRSVDVNSDPDTWWFSQMRVNKYEYHPAKKQYINPNASKRHLNPGKQVDDNDPYPTAEQIDGFKREEMLKFLGSNITTVVAVDGNYNSKTNRDDLIKLTHKVVSQLRKVYRSK